MTFPVTLLNDLAAQAVVADAVQVALQHGVFERLQQPQTPAALAATVNWQPEKAMPLLELLWSVGLLARDNGIYQTSAEVRPFLCQQGDRFIGDAWRFRLETFRTFARQLPDTLQQPAGVFSEQQGQDVAWAEAAKRQIAQEQRALTAARACEIAAMLPQFSRAATLLDMGGGPGLVSVALAQRYPQLSGVLQDLPLTAQVAQDNFALAGIADRFSAVSELSDDMRFDIIWCSSFLYFVADPAQTLARFFQLLKPGGVLISVHGDIPDDAAQAAQVLPGVLPLMMRGLHVSHEGERRAQLLAAGFVQIEQWQTVFPMSPLTVQLAFRAVDCRD